MTLGIKWMALLASASLSNAQLIPFYNDPTYSRNEPTNPPWFVTNDGQPSKLYHNGDYVSEETGTNDMGLIAAWAISAKGAKMGIVDMTAHGDRICALASLVSTASPIYRYELKRWDSGSISAGISNCFDVGCRVISVTTGFSTPDESLRKAIRYASNSVVVCAVPNVDGDLDSDLVDYPYRFYLPNVIGATSTDRNGSHYAPSGTGTNAIGAPGRNIVACGTYSSGTSHAAALITGAIGLMAGRFPGQIPEAYIQAIKSTAFDNGRINLTAALQVPVPTVIFQADGTVGITGLSKWHYFLEHSENLVEWNTCNDRTNGFWRAVVP